MIYLEFTDELTYKSCLMKASSLYGDCRMRFDSTRRAFLRNSGLGVGALALGDFATGSPLPFGT